MSKNMKVMMMCGDVPAEKVIEDFRKALGLKSNVESGYWLFHSPVLVKVKSGDGIGIDVGNAIVVTNKKNNVGMLVKSNYDEPFIAHETLQHNSHAIHSVSELKPGATYILYDSHAIYGSGFFACMKYLGNSRAIVCWFSSESQCDYELTGLKNTFEDISMYEVSIPA